MPHHTATMTTLTHCPLLWNLVVACGHFPEEVKPLLRKMAQVASDAYAVPPLEEAHPFTVLEDADLNYFP